MPVAVVCDQTLCAVFGRVLDSIRDLKALDEKVLYIRADLS